MSIYFWGVKEPRFGCFSNFFPVGFKDASGVTYWCSEQYFMKRKQELFDPNNAQIARDIMSSKSARKIKSLGRQVQNFDEHVWNEKKYGIMLEANLLKFSQNHQIQRVLLETGNSDIYEASPSDSIWGIGFAVSDLPSEKSLYGQNLLGKVLMETRGKLRVLAGQI